MKIGIVIPWRATPSRLKPLEKVLGWYDKHMPEAEIFYADRHGELWNPGGSRNDGVQMAQDAGCDVVIINDADTLPEISPLLEAVNLAKTDNLIHNPFTFCKYYDETNTDMFYAGKPIEQCYELFTTPDACGGIFVCTPEAWWRVGGMDEKFQQWGAEDNAMLYAHSVITGHPFVKHPGTIYCLGHEKQEQDTNYVESRSVNHNLYIDYLYITNPEDMLAFVKSKPRTRR